MFVHEPKVKNEPGKIYNNMFGGIVIHGDQIGRILGYPTANLDIALKDTKCKEGVYAAKAFLQKKEYKAALIIREDNKKVEVHLFDYDGGEFYGSYLEVLPIQKVSEIEPYQGEEKLKEKITNDIRLIKEVF